MLKKSTVIEANQTFNFSKLVIISEVKEAVAVGQVGWGFRQPVRDDPVRYVALSNPGHGSR